MSTFAEALQTLRQSILRDLRVAMPARVEAYDAATQKVRVQPLLREAYEDETGTQHTERLPVISDVPVQFPGAGGYFVTFPIAPGDTGTLLFADRSLDRWLTKGGEVDTGDVRTHHLSDAIFLPGLRPFATPRAGVSSTTAVLGKESGLGVHVGPTTIGLGEATPVDAVVKGTSYAAAEASAITNLSSLLALLITAVSGMTPQPGPTGGASTTAVGTLSAAAAPGGPLASLIAFGTNVAAGTYLSTFVKVK